MKRILVLAVVLMFMMSGMAFALEGGEKELGVSLTTVKISPEDGDDVTFLIGVASFGYFINANMLVGGAAIVAGAGSGDADTTSTSLNGFFKYHFITEGSAVVPYLGAQLGTFTASIDVGNNDYTIDGYQYGVLGGIKFFMSENTSVSAEYQLNKQTLEDDNGNDFDSDLSILLVGYQYYF